MPDLLLLHEVDKQHHLILRLSSALPDPWNPVFVRHKLEAEDRQGVFGSVAGQNDHEALHFDYAFQAAIVLVNK